jgi:hypothetical protein
MLTLQHADNSIKNQSQLVKMTTNIQLALIKTKTMIRKKIEPCLKGHGVSIHKRYHGISC